jgi:hypothetical protein
LKSEISGGFIMKKISIFALALVLAMSVMTGCRRADTTNTTAPSTTVAPTTRPTVPPTTTPPTTMPSTTTEPSMDILPGTEDTIDPTNGANESKAHF